MVSSVQDRAGARALSRFGMPYHPYRSTSWRQPPSQEAGMENTRSRRILIMNGAELVKKRQMPLPEKGRSS